MYDAESEGVVTTHCSKVGLNVMDIAFSGNQHHYRDIYYKNQVIKILKQLAVKNDPTKMELIKTLILKIREPSMYIHVLDDCFQYGIDLSNTYSTILSICSLQIQHEKSHFLSEDQRDGNEVILRQLNYYATVVSWFYRLLQKYHYRQDHSIFETSRPDLSDCCELLQLQTLYEEQFVISSAPPQSAFSHHDLPIFIQCIQSVFYNWFDVHLVLSLQIAPCFYIISIISTSYK